MTDDGVFAKCAWRLIPFMVLLYVVNFLDRTNVAFAALTMNQDLGFSPSVYGFGAGIFFLGYFLFQVPANVVLQRVGARRVVFCIMVVWGVISTACALVRGPESFYALRFLLGVAEAGFFPGMIFYLTLWFPRANRARFTASFTASIPLSNIVGGPLAGLILGMDGVLALHGWQWLFLLEGIPAVLLAFVVLKFLPDGPAFASWLTGEEKRRIAASLAAEAPVEHQDLWPALRDQRVIALGIVLFCTSCGLYGVTLWLPQIVQGMGFSYLVTSFIVGFQYLVALGAMLLWGRSSDARAERVWHVALPALFAAAGFALASATQSDLIVLAALTGATVGVLALIGPLFTLASSFLGGPAAAGGIALVNTIGILGGFLGPFVIGLLKEQTGGYASAMAMLAIVCVLAATIVLALARAMAARQMRFA